MIETSGAAAAGRLDERIRFTADMNGEEDDIPRWVAHAVTTAELPTSSRLPSGETTETSPAAAVDIDPKPSSSPDHELVPATDRPTSSSTPARVFVGAVVGLLLVVLFGVLAVIRPLGDGTGAGSATQTVSDGAVAIADDSAAAVTIDVEPLTTTPFEESVPAAVQETVPATVPGLSASSLEAHRGEAWAAGESAWAILSDGRIYVQGEVPDAEAGDLLTERLEPILGPDNVVAQYGIDLTRPAPVDPPLFIKETVAFEPRGDAVLKGSEWVLVLADSLMKRYPESTLTVVADRSTSQQSDGSTDLAQRRVKATVDFLAEMGVDRSRLYSEFHRSAPVGGDAANKPIEFVVRGLLAAADDESP